MTGTRYCIHLLAISALASCGSSEGHYIRVKEPAAAQLSGHWIRFGGLSLIPAARSLILQSPPPAAHTLEMLPDQTCDLGQELLGFVASCNQKVPWLQRSPPVCRWGLQPSPIAGEGQEVVLVTAGTDNAFLALRMAVARDTEGAFVLYGLCRNHEQYAFVRPQIKTQ
jgi:hypothetical protein